MTIPIAMLDERIRVHDALQLEFRQRLPFPEGGRANRYTSETFMYIPASLNINRLTFPKSHFYRSLKNYNRLQGPSFTLAQLAAPGGLLEKLQEYAARFPTFFDAATFSADDKKHLAAQEQTAKAFSMAFQRSLLEKTRSLTRWGKAGAIAAFAGEIREIMNTVLVAEKKAQANVIMRREEVASTRSLLNTAKLMEENRILYRLKELEYLERICDKVGSISLEGGGSVLEQLARLASPSAELLSGESI